MDANTFLKGLKEVSNVLLSPRGQKFLCGTYSNGKARNVVDALRDEYVSPKDREDWEKKKKKKKDKKKKKKDKKKNKSKNADIWTF